MAEHIPEDVIVKIVEQLPIKSLIRFTCVSKWWRSIILFDHQFAKSQFDHQQSRTSLRLLVSTASESEYESLYSETPLDSLVIKLSCPFKQPYHDVTLLSSCNGLVFASSYNNRACYEPRKDLPIFSWRANTWKTIQVPSNLNNFEEALHWYKESSRENKIVVFDLASEEFRTMPLPPRLFEPTNPRSFRGCLCVYDCRDNGYIYLWIMREYGVADSWAKLFTIKAPALDLPRGVICTLTPILATESSSLLLRYMYESNGKRESWLVRSGDHGQEKEFQTIITIFKKSLTCHVTVYKESLLWLH
ncbi:F-box protein At3g07870-like [Argentina anserina]|uniref:F-box protein At3g07870-like n=1 Tax=Argentina anserina TaxID=57926 RepID=UPI0021768BD5|nr:F-box protein At3g07870-like [Potentilla anserina]